jgi:hypothetical protein
MLMALSLKWFLHLIPGLAFLLAPQSLTMKLGIVARMKAIVMITLTALLNALTSWGFNSSGPCAARPVMPCIAVSDDSETMKQGFKNLTTMAFTSNVWHMLTIHHENALELMRELYNESEAMKEAFDEFLCAENWVLWEDREQEMCAFSLKYPGTLFQMLCEDDEGNTWKEYYMDGKVQTANGVIVYPDFDYDALQEPA